MKKIYIVCRNHLNNEEESLYKKNSLSEFDKFTTSQKAEVISICIQDIERIEYEEEVVIFRDIPLLEAKYQANREKLSPCYKGIYIDAENIEGFRKLTKTLRDSSYIPFDFIVYGSSYIEIKSICSIEIPKYKFDSEGTEMEFINYDSNALWKIKSRRMATETIKCVIIHPNNIHGWNTRQVVKDMQHYVHKINEIILKLKNIELSLMIDSSRYLSIPEMVIFNKLNIRPKLVNPIGVEEALYSSDLILFIPSAYRYHSNYRHLMNRMASEYKCKVLAMSQEVNKSEKRKGKEPELISGEKQVVEWVKENISTKKEGENKIFTLDDRLDDRRRYKDQLDIFISNEINKESSPLDRIAGEEHMIVVDWLMRPAPQNDIWIISGQMDFLSISKKLYENVKQYSMCKKIQKRTSNEESLEIDMKELSKESLEALRKIISFRESLASSNTDKANNIEKLLYETNRYVIKDVLIEICPNYCMVADVNEFLIDKTIWWS